MFVKRSYGFSILSKVFNNLKFENSFSKVLCSTILYPSRGYCQAKDEDDTDKKSLEYLPDILKLKLVTFNDRSVETIGQDKQSKYESRCGYHSSHTTLVTADDPVVEKLLHGITNGERSALAQGITLIESIHPTKRAQGQVLVGEILEHCRRKQKNTLNSVSSFRIGLSGPPGAGKSTHIEALGKMLTERKHKVAVLAVDPSSSTSGGSLLGDKTRMLKLALDPNAYIRPSPNSGNLGGVTRVTNDAIVLCEGAGYDIIIVETVGVGQSEFAVADMVDLFELLLPPAGGDELQGIKKGIVEVADMIVINKSDGDLIPAARRIQTEYISALKFIRQKNKIWRPCVLRVSSLSKEGMEEMWEKMKEYKKLMTESGEMERLRRRQHVRWMHNHIRDALMATFNDLPTIKKLTPELEQLVLKSAITPGQAADKILHHFVELIKENKEEIVQHKSFESSEGYRKGFLNC